MSLVQNLKLDLDHVGAFCTMQQQAGQDMSEVLVVQAAAMQARIKNIATCDTTQATTLTAAVNAGPWTNDQQMILAKLISDLVVAHAHTSKTRRMGDC